MQTNELEYSSFYSNSDEKSGHLHATLYLTPHSTTCSVEIDNLNAKNYKAL